MKVLLGLLLCVLLSIVIAFDCTGQYCPDIDETKCECGGATYGCCTQCCVDCNDCSVSLNIHCALSHRFNS